MSVHLHLHLHQPMPSGSSSKQLLMHRLHVYVCFLTCRVAQGSKLTLNEVEADDPDVSDLKLLPDTASIADKLKGCLQEVEEVPRDWTSLFDESLFKFDTSLIPEAVELYEKLNVKKQQLSLIPPSFEIPLPPLQPAVFPPAIREPPPPALELFDLDESFASETVSDCVRDVVASSYACMHRGWMWVTFSPDIPNTGVCNACGHISRAPCVHKTTWIPQMHQLTDRYRRAASCRVRYALDCRTAWLT